jgi:hypothetical protein
MLMSFARQYDLNPLARECYAYINKKTGLMQVGIQVDGWSKIANRDENFDGQEIEYHSNKDGVVTAMTTKTHVKGRTYPTVYRAEMKEWKRDTDVWQSMPIHQLYMKARDQGIRLAFGIAAYDPDDIERIEHSAIDITPQTQIAGPTSSVADTGAKDAGASASTASRASDKPPVREAEKVLRDEPSSASKDEGQNAGNADGAGNRPPANNPTLETRVDDGEEMDAVMSATEAATTASGAVLDNETALRAELDKLIDRSPPARINVLLGQQGVASKEDLSIDQVKTVTRILNRGKK